MSFVELHFHLLPGIDDGPSTIGESVELARLAAAAGTQTIVATTHVNPVYETEVSSLPGRVAEVVERLRRDRVALEVLCGAELAHEMVGRLSQRELMARRDDGGSCSRLPSLGWARRSPQRPTSFGRAASLS